MMSSFSSAVPAIPVLSAVPAIVVGEWRQRAPHPRNGAFHERSFVSPEKLSQPVIAPDAPSRLPKRSRVEVIDLTERKVYRRLEFGNPSNPRVVIELDDDSDTDEEDMIVEEPQPSDMYTDPGVVSYIRNVVSTAISNAVTTVVREIRERVSTFFQCSICNFGSISVIPLVMPCGRHTVCFGCAHQMVKPTRRYNEEEQQFTYILTCPQCRDSEECCNRLELFDSEIQIEIDQRFISMCNEAARIETGRAADKYYIPTARCPFDCGEESADHEHAMFCGRGLLEGYFHPPQSVTGDVRRQGLGMVAMIRSISNNPILHYQDLSENITTLMESIYYRFSSIRYLSQDAARTNQRSLNTQLLRELESFSSGIANAHATLNAVTGSPQRRDVSAHLGRLPFYRHLRVPARDFNAYYVDETIESEVGTHDHDQFLWQN
jgi:hypothetical protein